MSHQKTCVVDGLEHALVYNWNGDNAGPHASVGEYATAWSVIARAFPNATGIYASTLDNFTQHLLAPQIAAKLPVVSDEVADSWVYGVPSDPQKVSRMRAIDRVWTEAAAEAAAAGGGGGTGGGGGIAQLLATDAVLRNATRFALKLGEHTWGKDVKSNLFDNWSWRNADFARARAAGSRNASQYAALESSWWEQRAWGVAVAADTLADAGHPMAARLAREFDELQPRAPSTDGFVAGRAGEDYACGALRSVAFDGTGALSTLRDGKGHAWADAQHTLLGLVYRAYSAAEVQRFFSSYCKSRASWVAHDYGRPGLPTDIAGGVWRPVMSRLLVRCGAHGACSFVVESAFDSTASQHYGAPASVVTTVAIDPSLGTVAANVSLLEKTSTRLPEAMFVELQPTGGAGLRWSADKLGEWISPGEIVDGGSKHLHGITQQGMRATTADGAHTLQVQTLDAAVGNFGALNAYPSPVNTTADTGAFGSSFVLWDNLWGTNYIMWWPFAAQPPSNYSAAARYFPPQGNADLLSRFVIRLS